MLCTLSLRQIQKCIYVKGSCRGFLLLTSSFATCKLTYFIVWNPSTGIVKWFSRELNHRYVCGIAYDSSMDDYVLVIVQFSKHRGQQVHCFSLRTGSWSCTEGSTNVLILPNLQSWRGFRLEGSLLNGTLHWLLHNDDDNCSKIIAFDVIKRKLSEIPLPFYDFFNLRSKLNLLMVMGGYLCVYSASYLPA